MFFDQPRASTTSKATVCRSVISSRRYGGDFVANDESSKGSSDSRLVHRGDSGNLFNVSTHHEQLHADDSLSSVYSVSLYDEGGHSDRVLCDVDCLSDQECTLRAYQSPTGRVISGYWNGHEFVSGRITWNDGREYNGALKGSVPDGFGSYRTSGGKEYTGYWRSGLQHGIGSYVTDKDGCRLQRRGIWENGQLVRWLDDDIEVKDEFTKRTLLDDIMATPTATPVLSPSSIAASLPSVGTSPCAHMGGM